ncbi:glucuronate isomerase [Treponema parvum]|uniref:glucuronate isomerase n=1 Tax=Treponema parvum TaxID=138851 RepID=UPI001AEBAB80|nr:glucuronate isomerase [Treponema parvum]QTQ16001.1 glucuronate isomerase [Treponema parvum]
MKKFMDKNFLLETKTAQKLYKAVENSPIWDFHCHLPPKEIAENKKFPNLSEIWLGSHGYGDHYKWRQMRTNGVPESIITGDNADPFEKFIKWTQTIENLAGNPLYHWTHLELQRYFNIYEPLTTKTAPAIWEKANAQLQSDEMSVKGILKKFNVYAVGTTDDPADTLEYHKAIAAGTAPIGKIETKVRPSFRPDKALNIDKPTFAEYIPKLAKAAGINIKNTDDVIKALELRLDFFVEAGCKASDHGLEFAPFRLEDDAEINKAFKAAMAGKPVSPEMAEAYRTKVLLALGLAYAKRNVVMQLHMNAIRDLNKKMFKLLGPDTGFDAVHDNRMAEKLSGLLNLIEENGGLPKTVLYTLNPKDYYVLGTAMGCFQGTVNGEPIRGKVQLGCAWWFCDHYDGMTEHLKVLGNLGMLSSFVGMLTDSRSFLSYPRHEYFRRILCNILGNWVENGEFPNDEEILTRMVKDISFNNALNYFGK